MSKDIAMKGLLALFIVFITLAYWEMGVRVIGKTAFPLLRTDPEVGSIHVKNFSGYAWDAPSARKNYIHTNSLGYVGDDVPLEKPTSTVRIAFLGDSGLSALQVDYYKNFTELLQGALNTSALCGKNFEVMNFGVGSAGTFTEYQTYKKKIAPFHPDYVFVMFANDYDDNIIKSGYDLEHYAEERKSVGLKEFLLQFELPKFIFHKLIANKTFIGLLHTVGILEGAAVPAQPAEGTTTSATSTPLFAFYYTYTFDIFTKFNKLVTQDGSKFGVIMFSSEGVDYAHKGDWRNDRNAMALMDFLASSSISYFNPSDQLADAHAAYGKCITVDCGTHFNEEGHRAMARILYAHMKDELLKNDPTCAKK